MRIHECRSCQSAELLSHPRSRKSSHIERAFGSEKPGPPGGALSAAIGVLRELCAVPQITETVPPGILYQRDYPYFSSSSPAFLQHAASIAQRLIRERGLGADSLVMEIACNDGYLLRNFVRQGIPCLGIDPAAGPAEHARSIGVPTINDFFSLASLNVLRARGSSPTS